jgi:hypothetical protein
MVEGSASRHTQKCEVMHNQVFDEGDVQEVFHD